MRTIDVARQVGCSVQQVRKLEAAGVLRPTTRTTSGYRQWDGSHVASLRAYQQMTSAIGPVEARLIVRDAHRDQDAMLARLDAAHARLHQERRELDLTRQAVESINSEPLIQIDPADSMSIGTLAIAVGVRPSTLRHWEAEKLLRPGRGRTGARTYSPIDVRDARLIHQLRQAGHRIAPLRDLLPTLRTGEAWNEVLTERSLSIQTRSRSLMNATVALTRCVSPVRPSRPTHVP